LGKGPETDSVLYGQTARIAGFDPVATGDLASSRAMQRVYEGLLQYDYIARPYRLVPSLAADMPTVSDDGLSYRFELRKGIYFPDDPCFPNGVGRELTAEDVLYSIKRLADMNTLSSGYWTVRGKIEGLDAFREKSAGQADCYGESIEGLRALDRYTIEFRLIQPYPQFLNVLAMHYFSVIPREAVEFYGDQFSSHPVGTAAYRLKTWKRNYRLEYEVNPAWKKHPRPEPLPAFETIVDYVIADGTTKWLLFSSGQLDIMGLSAEQFQSVLRPDGSLPAELADKGVQLHQSSKLDVFYLGFNMEDEVVGTNRALRQALSCAFDHASWVRLYEHQVDPLYGPVPQPLQAAKREAGPYGFNLKKAKQLLSAAGYTDGIDPKTGRRLELVLDSSGADDAQTRQSNELLSGFMAALGIELRVNYSNRPTFFDRVRRGEVQLFRLSWIADYSDEHNFLQLFYGPNAHGCNRANYRNSTYDKLFESFMVLGSCEARDVLAEQMVKILVEDCPWIFMHQPVDTVLVGPRVDQYVPHAFPGGMTRHLRLRELKLEK
jgi:ABC-type transport system substrate-binding protein